MCVIEGVQVMRRERRVNDRRRDDGHRIDYHRQSDDGRRDLYRDRNRNEGARSPPLSPRMIRDVVCKEAEKRKYSGNLAPIRREVERAARRELEKHPYRDIECVVKEKAKTKISYARFPVKPPSATAAQTTTLLSLGTPLGGDVASLIGRFQQEANIIEIVNEEVKRLIRSKGPGMKSLRSKTGPSDEKIRGEVGFMIRLIENYAFREGEHDYPLLHQHRSDIMEPRWREQLEEVIRSVLYSIADGEDDNDDSDDWM